MKAIIKLGILTLLMLVLQTSPSVAQKKGHHHSNKKIIVVNKGGGYHKHYNRRVYHPHWGPKLAYHRRWVFFPRYNLYWDNRNNYYVYNNNGIWVNSPTPPTVIVNVNLADEKKYELNEPNDSINDVQKDNATHVQNYPVSPKTETQQ